MSSKFSSPFLKKSPLYGAYASGAGGMVTISYQDVHKKFQDDLAKNIKKATAKSPCDELDKRLLATDDTKISAATYAIAKEKCAKSNNNNNNNQEPFKGVKEAGSGKTTGSASMFPGFE